MVTDRKNKKALCREGIDVRDAFAQKLLAVLSKAIQILPKQIQRGSLDLIFRELKLGL